MGDFNARIGRNNSLLFSKYAEHCLYIINTYFRMVDKSKTWTYPQSKHWLMIEWLLHNMPMWYWWCTSDLCHEWRWMWIGHQCMTDLYISAPHSNQAKTVTASYNIDWFWRTLDKKFQEGLNPSKVLGPKTRVHQGWFNKNKAQQNDPGPSLLTIVSPWLMGNLNCSSCLIDSPWLQKYLDNQSQQERSAISTCSKHQPLSQLSP